MKQILFTLFLFTRFAIIQAQSIIDTNKYAIFKHDNKIDHWVFDEKSKPYNLTQKDVAELEIILSNCIEKYNRSQMKEFNRLNKKEPQYHFDIKSFVIDLSKYRRQLIAVINSRGEKEVWINCFRPFTNFKFNYWHESLVEVNDGGNSFFNVKLNLTLKKYYELRANGEA